MKKLLAIVLLFSFSCVSAGQLTVHGAGMSTCDEYVKFYKEKDETYYLHLSWAQGFLTAVSQQRGFQVDKGLLDNEIGVYLKNFCTANPQKVFYQAVVTLSYEFKRN